MVRLVDDLLEVSRITRGRIELRKESLDLAHVLEHALEASRPLIDAARHHLTVEIPSERLVVEGIPPRQRILVADDHHDTAESLGLLLELLGAETRIAHSGPDALALLETFGPSVAVVDIGMPGMDGYEVARRIRKSDGGEKVRLI